MGRSVRSLVYLLGAILIVARKERRVRIEVGYGLEPVLTDALSSLIIQRAIVPAFKAGRYEQGIVEGTEALIAQLSLPDAEAKAAVAALLATGGPGQLTGLLVQGMRHGGPSYRRNSGRSGQAPSPQDGARRCWFPPLLALQLSPPPPTLSSLRSLGTHHTACALHLLPMQR